MNETREDANGILTKFHFGGILVVIGLLNADLVLAKGFDLTSIASGPAIIIMMLVVVISGVYFYLICERMYYHQGQYRLTKHKYELTLYAVQLNATGSEWLSALEHGAKKDPDGPLSFPEDSDFTSVARYLHDHHARRMEEYQIWRPWSIAMLIVGMAIIVRISGRLMSTS
jgi:hypothetical protein